MKIGWILGAAFLSLAIVIVALLATTDTASVERLSAHETLDGIDVPVIGTVGDFPDPAHRHVVNVTADGRIVVEGTTYDGEGPLIRELKRRVGEMPNAALVLRVDGGLPWRVLESLIVSCGSAKVRRICLAVRGENDGREGALGSLPPHVDDGGRTLRLIAQQIIDVAPTTNHVQLQVLFADLRRVWAKAEKKSVLLRIDPRTPTRTALAVIDVAVRAGVESIDALDSSTYERSGLRFEEGSAPSSLRLNGRAIERSSVSDPMPPTQRMNLAVDLPRLAFCIDDRSDEHPLPAGFAPK